MAELLEYLARQLVDKPDEVRVEEVDEGDMTGVPMARAWSLDKRWAFTMYGAGANPFVHSLDTRNAYAVCIDLPQRFAKIELGTLEMEMQKGDRLVIKYRTTGKTLAVLDTKNFRVVSTAR